MDVFNQRNVNYHLQFFLKVIFEAEINRQIYNIYLPSLVFIIAQVTTSQIFIFPTGNFRPKSVLTAMFDP